MGCMYIKILHYYSGDKASLTRRTIKLTDVRTMRVTHRRSQEKAYMEDSTLCLKHSISYRKSIRDVMMSLLSEVSA